MQQARLFDITTLYRVGKPFKTESVVYDTTALSFNGTDTITGFVFQQESNNVPRTILTLKLQDEDKVFGLGTSLGSLNKRGKKYTLFNTDDSLHTPDKESLYGSHPFLIITGGTELSLFIDFPGKIIFDIGFTDRTTLKITIAARDFDLYLFDSGNKYQVIREYLQLTGAPYLPPRWAFGYQQSRWSYPTARTVLEIVEKFRANQIPCDVIYFDIDYMQDYKVFTVNTERFPAVRELLAYLRGKGIKVIPIIDPGVKLDESYELYREGKNAGCYCQTEQGADFIGAVWPGLVAYPDFLNRKTRDWWTAHCRQFLEMGFSGFWNDMNEPAIFYTPAELEKSLAFVQAQPEALTTEDYFALRGTFKQLANRDDDYRRIYHITDEGERVNHYSVHNLYGYYMAKATAAAVSALTASPEPANRTASAAAAVSASAAGQQLAGQQTAGQQPAGLQTIGSQTAGQALVRQQRLFILSRSNCVGLHRQAAIWTGDNHSWWEHMFQNIQMLMSLNMCGFLFAGADIGGFGGNTSAELVIRWTQLGVFNPLFRNHSAAGTRQQEPFAFDSETTAIVKRAIEFRYALLPFLYSEMLAAIIHLTPLVKPIWFEFDDPISTDIEDQFLWGNSILVAPVHKPNNRARFVYLPKVRWLYWKVSDYRERNCQVYRPGTHYVPAALTEIPVFLRENSMFLLTQHQNYVGEKEITEMTIIAFVTRQATYTYYTDDGATLDYQQAKYASIDFIIARDEEDFTVNYTVHPCPSVPLAITDFFFEIYDEHGRIFKKRLTNTGTSGSSL